MKTNNPLIRIISSVIIATFLTTTCVIAEPLPPDSQSYSPFKSDQNQGGHLSQTQLDKFSTIKTTLVDQHNATQTPVLVTDTEIAAYLYNIINPADKTNLDTLKANYDTSVSERSQAHQEYDALVARLQPYYDQINNAKSALDNVTYYINQLTQSVGSFTQERSALLGEIASLQNSLNQKNLEMQTEKGGVTTVEQELAALNAILSTLTQDKNSKKTTLDNAQTVLNQKTQEKSALEAEIAQLEIDKTNANNQVTLALNALNQKAQEKAALAVEISQLNADKTSALAALTLAQDQLAQAQDAYDASLTQVVNALGPTFDLETSLYVKNYDADGNLVSVTLPIEYDDGVMPLSDKEAIVFNALLKKDALADATANVAASQATYDGIVSTLVAKQAAYDAIGTQHNAALTNYNNKLTAYNNIVSQLNAKQTAYAALIVQYNTALSNYSSALTAYTAKVNDVKAAQTNVDNKNIDLLASYEEVKLLAVDIATLNDGINVRNVQLANTDSMINELNLTLNSLNAGTTQLRDTLDNAWNNLETQINQSGIQQKLADYNTAIDREKMASAIYSAALEDRDQALSSFIAENKEIATRITVKLLQGLDQNGSLTEDEIFQKAQAMSEQDIENLITGRAKQLILTNGRTSIEPQRMDAESLAEALKESYKVIFEKEPDQGIIETMTSIIQNAKMPAIRMFQIITAIDQQKMKANQFTDINTTTFGQRLQDSIASFLNGVADKLKDNGVDTQVIQSTLSYLSGLPVSMLSCGTIALSELFSGIGQSVSVETLTGSAILSDVLSGSLNQAQDGELSLSMDALKNAAKDQGMTLLGQNVTVDQLSTINSPVIAHVNSDHFVMVDKIENSTVSVFDPKLSQKTQMTVSSFASVFTGNVLTMNLVYGANLLTNAQMQNIYGAGIFSSIKSAVSSVAKSASSAVSSAAKSVASTVSSAAKAVSSAVSSAASSVSSAAKSASSAVSSAASAVSSAAKSVASAVSSAASSVSSAAKSVASTVSSAAKSVASAASSVSSAVSSAAKSVASTVSSAAKSVASAVSNTVKSAASAISSIATSAGSAVLSGAQKVGTALVSAASYVGTALVNTGSYVASAASNTAASLGAGLSSAAAYGTGLITSAYNGASNTASSVGNYLSNVFKPAAPTNQKQDGSCNATNPYQGQSSMFEQGRDGNNLPGANDFTSYLKNDGTGENFLTGINNGNVTAFGVYGPQTCGEDLGFFVPNNVNPNQGGSTRGANSSFYIARDTGGSNVVYIVQTPESITGPQNQDSYNKQDRSVQQGMCYADVFRDSSPFIPNNMTIRDTSRSSWMDAGRYGAYFPLTITTNRYLTEQQLMGALPDKITAVNLPNGKINLQNLVIDVGGGEYSPHAGALNIDPRAAGTSNGAFIRTSGNYEIGDTLNFLRRQGAGVSQAYFENVPYDPKQTPAIARELGKMLQPEGSIQLIPRPSWVETPPWENPAPFKSGTQDIARMFNEYANGQLTSPKGSTIVERPNGAAYPYSYVYTVTKPFSTGDKIVYGIADGMSTVGKVARPLGYIAAGIDGANVVNSWVNVAQGQSTVCDASTTTLRTGARWGAGYAAAEIAAPWGAAAGAAICALPSVGLAIAPCAAIGAGIASIGGWVGGFMLGDKAGEYVGNSLCQTSQQTAYTIRQPSYGTMIIEPPKINLSYAGSAATAKPIAEMHAANYNTNSNFGMCSASNTSQTGSGIFGTYFGNTAAADPGNSIFPSDPSVLNSRFGTGDMRTRTDGGTKITWNVDANTRVRYETAHTPDIGYEHVTGTVGDRHTIDHYHYDTKPQGATWNNADRHGTITTETPAGARPGEGTGFKPGEQIPKTGVTWSGNIVESFAKSEIAGTIRNSNVMKALGETKFIKVAGSPQTLETVSSVSRSLKWLGPAALVVDGAIGGYQIYNAYQQEKTCGPSTAVEETTGNVVGRIAGAAAAGWAGAQTGAIIGAMIGSVVPGLGTAIGAAAGGIIGGIVGGFIGYDVGGAAGQYVGKKIGESTGGKTWEAVKSVTTTAATAVKNTATAAAKTVAKAATATATAVKNVTTTVANTATKVVTAGTQTVTKVATPTINAVKDAVKTVTKTATQVVTAATQTVTKVATAALDTAKKAATTVVNAAKNLWNKLIR